MKFSMIMAVFLFGLAAAQDTTDTTTTGDTTTTDSTDTTTTTTTTDSTSEKRDFISPDASFYVQSENLNKFDGTRTVGAILGFAAFGVAFMTTVVMIFIDINKRKNDYEEMIIDDKVEMTRLGMDSKMGELNEELKKKLAGVKDEDEGDDQLMGEASKLSPADFASFRQ